MAKLNPAFLLIPIYVAISCSGLILMKTKLGIWSHQFVAGVFLWGLGAILWIVVLRITPLSVAFPIASSLLLVGSTAAGYLLLNEKISMIQLCGIVMVLLGVLLISSGKGAL